MGEETRRSCDANLEASENRGLCAVPKSDAELNRFSYLKGKGELVSPYPGLFASADVWERLLPSQRAR